MSAKAIQAIFEKKLKTIRPQMPTAYENLPFTPNVGQEYQRVHMLVNKPVDLTLNLDIVEKLGIFQVTLCYPAGKGRGTIQDHADEIQEAFVPQGLHDGPLEVDITETPEISSPYNDGDRYCIAVSIPWNSFFYK